MFSNMKLIELGGNFENWFVLARMELEFCNFAKNHQFQIFLFRFKINIESIMEGVYYENAKRFWNRLMTLLEINHKNQKHSILRFISGGINL